MIDPMSKHRPPTPGAPQPPCAVSVPASTRTLGPGCDLLGLALSLRLEVTLRTGIRGDGGAPRFALETTARAAALGWPSATELGPERDLLVRAFERGRAVFGAPVAGAPVAGAPSPGAPVAGAPSPGAPVAGAPSPGAPVAVDSQAPVTFEVDTQIPGTDHDKVVARPGRYDVVSAPADDRVVALATDHDIAARRANQRVACLGTLVGDEVRIVAAEDDGRHARIHATGIRQA